MTPIDRILPLLQKVKQRQPGQWSACCPAHADKSPSLSVRETPEGAVLLYCFSGCGATDILSAIGLTLVDLYPAREPSSTAPRRTARLLTAGQALDLLASEALLVAVAAGNLASGVALSDDDRARLRAAAGRCRWLRDEAKGVSHV